MDLYQQVIAKSRYARWIEDKNRREHWDETVKRYVDWLAAQCKKHDLIVTQTELNQIYDAIYGLQVMPSMRALMTAGPALERDNVAGFNCSFVAMDNQRAFDEIVYILMCGTGVGFSVEEQFVSQLPIVSEAFHKTDTAIVVSDSKVGWASAYRELISLLYSGKTPTWDVSKVRPKGTKLKTFGGRASGPEPLVDLFKFTIDVFKKAAGRRLNALEVHDIVCKIADIVVVGGVRRSALISLSDLTDERMRVAKSGAWWEENVQRALANNSAAYKEKPEIGQFMKEWQAIYDSKSGERGIFNRNAARNQAIKTGRRDPDYPFGTNPCGEINLRPMSFCNLSEVVVRPEDTLETLKAKVRIASIIGTIQSSMTNFRYLRSVWRKNVEEERLLGVSLTGIMDNPLTADPSPKDLEELRAEAIESNQVWADKLGINPSVSITCVKPSGTVSQLVACSSGIHPAYSDYYIRTVRADLKDPLTAFLKDAGIPCEPDVTKPDSIAVFSFPQKAPNNAVTREELAAIQQLEIYLKYHKHWCEHNPSITVYIREDEWLKVGAWVYAHFDEIGGISFLPYSDHVYKQAPYQPCSKDDYQAAFDQMPKEIDWNILSLYEKDDSTTGTQELACVGGSCEISKV